jgi:hypothetical protein
MRGVAYPVGERELLMRLHEQGVSLSGGWPILSRRLRKGGAAFRWPASVFHPSLGGRPSHRFPLPQDVAR